MLLIVARWVTDSVDTPGPSKMNALLIPPFTVSRRSISRITSLAETHGESSFSSTTRTDQGCFSSNGNPAMATAASIPPIPRANIPMAPAVVVCESEPTIVCQGTSKRSRWT